jgi:6-phosphogluconate dehydrogenase
VLAGPNNAKFDGDVQAAIEDIRQALYASKIISYAQGYMLLKNASEAYKWNINLGGLALMWRGGCIIRSRFLGEIKLAYDRNPELTNLLLDHFFTDALKTAQDGWRRTFSNALSFYDSYRCARLPANLLQAQRDYFGAHTYERTDKPRGEFFHSNWTGQGGTVASTTYNA